MKSAPAIAFDYRPCRAIGIAIGCLTLLALLAISLSGVGPAWGWTLVVFALSIGLHALYRHFGPGVGRIAHTESGWLLVDRQGQEQAVALAGHVSRGFLLVLRFADESGRRLSFVLTADNIEAEQRRRLLLVLAAETRPVQAGAGTAQERVTG